MRPKIAVHIHVFYLDLVEKLLFELKNLSDFDYDLFVTMIKDDKWTINKIKQFKKDAKIWVLENRGYDVGPFVDFLNHIDLDDYDYILKLYTKKHTGTNKFIDLFKDNIVYYKNRDLWYRLLINSLIGSKHIVNKNILMLEKDKNIGMIGSKYLISSVSKTYSKLLPILPNIKYPKRRKIRFIAGTMFFVKSKLFQPIKDNFKLNDFEISDSSKKDKTLAHHLERLFGCIVIAQGYKIKGFDKNWTMIIFSPLNKLLHFLIHFGINFHGYYILEILGIRVLKIKIRN